MTSFSQKFESTTTFPHLQRGDQGTGVALLQHFLKRHGFYICSVDGDFGPNTQAIVRKFQGYFGLLPSGVVGPSTWELLMVLPNLD